MTDWNELQRIVDDAFEKPDVHVPDVPTITITTNFPERFPDLIEFVSNEVLGTIVAWNKNAKRMAMWRGGKTFVEIEGRYENYALAHTQARRELESIAKVL